MRGDYATIAVRMQRNEHPITLHFSVKGKKTGFYNKVLLVSAKSWKRLNYASVLPINRHYRCIFQKVSPSHTFIPFFLADSRFLWQNKAILLSYSSSWPAVKSFKTHALGHFSSIYWLVLADSRWKIQNEESLGGLLLKNGIHKRIKPAFESHFFVTKKF